MYFVTSATYVMVQALCVRVAHIVSCILGVVMESFFEREGRVNTPLYHIVKEERFRRYTLKTMLYNGMQSLWVFRNDVLQGVLYDQTMMEVNHNRQVVYCYPHSFQGLRYAEWDAEPTATDADYAVALSRLKTRYTKPHPENETDGVMLEGLVRIVVTETLDACAVYVGGVMFIALEGPEPDRPLVATRSSRNWGYVSDHAPLLEEHVSIDIIDVAEYVRDYLISTLPTTDSTLH